MNIESRIESLEAIRHDRNSALPLIDYRWNGPKVEGLAYRIEGQAVIEREPGESDDAYKQRAKNICQHSHRGRTLPLLQVTGG
jgi:hypothetical protein